MPYYPQPCETRPPADQLQALDAISMTGSLEAAAARVNASVEATRLAVSGACDFYEAPVPHAVRLAIETGALAVRYSPDYSARRLGAPLITYVSFGFNPEAAGAVLGEASVNWLSRVADATSTLSYSVRAMFAAGRLTPFRGSFTYPPSNRELTPAEQRSLVNISFGKGGAAAAKRGGMSLKALNTHLSNTREKLGAATLLGAVYKGFYRGILDFEPNSTPPPHLTYRELEVAYGIVLGHGNSGIGKELSLSSTGVRNHAGHLFDKFGISSRITLIRKMFEHGLVLPKARPDLKT